MRYRLVVQHLLRPIPPLLIGVLAGMLCMILSAR